MTFVSLVLISVPLSTPANAQVTSQDLLAAKALLAPKKDAKLALNLLRWANMKAMDREDPPGLPSCYCEKSPFSERLRFCFLPMLPTESSKKMGLITSPAKIELAKKFVTLGFGDALEGETLPFRSLDFLTDLLTTAEAQAILPIVSTYNNFDGHVVARAIQPFSRQVEGWKFGRAGSPLLVVCLPYWTIHVEESPVLPGSRKFSAAETEALLADLKSTFLSELKADYFEQMNPEIKMEYGAWWD